VLSPPGTDRIFLHCPGCNDTFGPEDIDPAKLRGAQLFHFGYPPLMRRMYERGGAELARLLAIPRKLGLTVSLDMSRPDPQSPSGRVAWLKVLRRVLPLVDVFLPSIEELLFMVDRPRHDTLTRRHGARLFEYVDAALLRALSDRVLGMGTAIVVIKLGDQGLYLRTTAQRERLLRCGAARPRNLDAWLGRELLAPCFRVKVAGTTGSGDCTIAGFLAALLRGEGPVMALTAGAAVGACCVERADATSGVRPWAQVRARLARGWRRLPCRLRLPGWKRVPLNSTLAGPSDAHGGTTRKSRVGQAQRTHHGRLRS
jgi:sugar/nucleoside kinase (ribokinase family)